MSSSMAVSLSYLRKSVFFWFIFDIFSICFYFFLGVVLQIWLIRKQVYDTYFLPFFFLFNSYKKEFLVFPHIFTVKKIFSFLLKMLAENRISKSYLKWTEDHWDIVERFAAVIHISIEEHISANDIPN